jgi:hypothetical protein
LKFEDIFCSKPRMKILRLKGAQLSTSDVEHRVGANYEPVLRHLTLVKREGVVAERFWGLVFSGLIGL